MADSTTVDAVVNPKRVLERQMKEADPPDTADPKKGSDKGDLPGPNSNFFKPRDHSGDKAGLEKALKNRK